MLQRSVDIFDNHPLCTAIILALPADQLDHDKTQSQKPLYKVIGGATRQASVDNGLKALEGKAQDHDLVLIHDAARPFLAHTDLESLLDAFAADPTLKAATLVKRVSDTLLAKNGDRPDRDQLYALQTPQAFHYALICKAHKAARAQQNQTDDTALVTDLGESVKLVEAQHFNEKITFAQDLKMAEKLWSPADYETRTGQGFDVHAFEDAPSERKLILCGVEVPHERALKGHSDADVGLHTLTDAILGALAQGDIGRHFPPSDPAFKNMDSAVFLEKARDLVAESQGRIINIDLTLICEAPKITPHAPAMIARVASILQLDPARISIKATTTEKLGFTGRQEGIAAQAVATVKVPAL